MDILNNNIGKTEIAPRKPGLTKALIKNRREKNSKYHKRQRV
jgi:hypothetical protein